MVQVAECHVSARLREDGVPSQAPEGQEKGQRLPDQPRGLGGPRQTGRPPGSDPLPQRRVAGLSVRGRPVQALAQGLEVGEAGSPKNTVGVGKFKVMNKEN